MQIIYANDDFEDIDFFEDDDSYVKDDVYTNSQIKDPLEKFNKFNFKIFTVSDKYFFEPVSKVYGKLPDLIIDEVNTELSYIDDFYSLIKTTLGFDTERMSRTSSRLIMNSFVGFFGLFDIASEFDVKKVKYSYGDLLRRYKIPEGPYFFNPLGGAGALIDAGGTVVSIGLNNELMNMSDQDQVNFTLVKIIDTRYQITDAINAAKQISSNLYIATRNFYFATKKPTQYKRNKRNKLREFSIQSEVFID
jgi:phospholipid-binding lipoprotein MlaA